MARRALVDMEGNTGADTREKSCAKPPVGHHQGGGLDEETEGRAALRIVRFNTW